MLFFNLEDNLYKLKVFNYNNYKYDLSDYDNIKEQVIKIIKQVITEHNIKGLLKINIYIYKFNIDIIIKKIYQVDLVDNLTNIKLTFYMNNTLLYKIDYFDLIENINSKNKKMYYYNNNFYLDCETLNEQEYFNILEFIDSEINNSEKVNESIVIFL